MYDLFSFLVIRMPSNGRFKYKVRIVADDFPTPAAIAQAPRFHKPEELAAACSNIAIEAEFEKAPETIEAFLRYCLTDFFALLHRTGLYNRQPALWQALSKISEVSAVQLSQGWILRQEPIDAYDILFADARGRKLVLGRCIETGPTISRPESLCNSFLREAEKSKGTIAGLIFCCTAPFDQGILERVRKLTASSDPVGRYESIVPSLSAPIDLVEARFENEECSFSLTHPDLSPSKKRPAATSSEDGREQGI